MGEQKRKFVAIFTSIGSSDLQLQSKTELKERIIVVRTEGARLSVLAAATPRVGLVWFAELKQIINFVFMPQQLTFFLQSIPSSFTTQPAKDI